MSKKKYFLITLIALIVVVVFLYLFRLVGNSTLITGEYETSTVDSGMVYASEETTGIVEPANEVIILCPVSSVIKKISKKPGSYVFTGETILTLDPDPVESQIEKLSDQLNIMQNDLDKNRLNARGIKVDLDYDLQVKKLRIVSLKSDLENEEELLKVGGISPSRVDKTKQELTLAEQDLKTTTEKNSIRLKQLEIEEAGILLKIDIQKKELERNHELLRKMIVRAPSSGIILTMQGSEGEKVNTDALLVRMSDLSILKIRASIGINKVGIIKTGGIVYAIVENEKVLGTVGNIKPIANDEKIDFDVFLDENKHPRLIPNQKVEIRIVTQQAPNVLRLKRGNLINKNKKQYVYVLDKDKAVRRRIETGLSDMEYIQVLSGLQEGEKVIISASVAFRHMKEINIK
jgi:HlyD family secretion protein